MRNIIIGLTGHMQVGKDTFYNLLYKKDKSFIRFALADELIIVTNPEMPAITDALKTIKIAEQMKKTILGVIVTRVRKNDTI